MNDTHWNEYGASIGFSHTIDFLNKVYNLKINKPRYNIVDMYGKIQTGRDEINHLRIIRFIRNFKETQYSLSLEPSYKVKVCDINKENGDIGNCYQDEIITTNVFEPKYSYNKCATSPYKVLIVADSFFTYNSKLYRATFKEVWNFHFYDFYGEKLQNFINIHKPDIIIYQAAERHFPNYAKF